MVATTSVGDPSVVAPARGRRSARVLIQALLVAAAAALTVWLGTQVPTRGLGFAVTVAAGIGGVLVLGALALQRFEWFVWAVLLVRPVLDVTKGERGASSGSGELATLMGGAVILVGVVWLGGLSRERRRLPLGLISRALVLLVVSSLISTLRSPDMLTSALQVARIVGAVMLFVVLEQLLRSREMALRALRVCALSTLFPLMVGAVQLATDGGVTSRGLTRLNGSFLHPNTFGFFLVMIILVGYSVRPYLSRRPRWVINGTLLLAAVELVFTYSRGSWIVLALGLLVIGVLADRRIFVVLPMSFGLAWLAVPAVQQRLADLAQEETLGGRPGNSAIWRVAHMEELLASARGDTVFGIGPKMADFLTEGGRPPHNDAVRLFIENGIVGLAIYLLFLFALVLLAIKALRTLRFGFDRGLAVGFTATVAAFLADSMGANLITQFVLLIYVLALAAIVQAWIAYDEVVAAQGDNAPQLRASPDTPVSRATTGLTERPVHGTS